MKFPHPMRRAGDRARLRDSRRFRRGMYLLPSLFTTANMAAGYYAISQTIMGAVTGEPRFFNYAAIAVGFAILFDGLDGRIARMTNTTSDFGKELDSLADAITFGVAPALLGWIWGFRFLYETTGAAPQSRLVQVGAIASFLFLTAGVSRLARFNIQANPQPSNPGRPGRKYFVGMPIPAGAGVIVATVHFTQGDPIVQWWLAAIWAAMMISVAFLMVSTWRFYSFKDINLRARHPFQIILIIGIFIAAVFYFSEYVLFFMALTYMLSGVMARLSYVLRRPHHPTYEEARQAQ